MLANLVLVTRPASEIANVDEAAHWIGLPGFDAESQKRIQLVLAFDTEEERDQLVEQIGVKIAKKNLGTWSAWWPPREREDLRSVRFETPK